jgi:hypothetical protein
MRIIAPILFSMVLSGGAVLAQSESAARERAEISAQQETPDEVIVRGRRLGELRVEIEQARIRAYDIFNEVNSNDDFDVSCRNESRSGTRMPQQVCRAQFEDRISSRAAHEYISTLKWVCPDGVTQDCIFSDYSSSAISAAQGVEGEAPIRRKQLTQEITRLANENDEFAQAILDWYEANQQYDAARKRRNDD